MRSRMMSVESVTMILYLLVSERSTAQVPNAGTHEERSYGQVNLECPDSQNQVVLTSAMPGTKPHL